MQIKNSLLATRQFFAVVLLVLTSVFSVQADICKMVMCGNTYTGGSARPNFMIGKTQTIVIYGQWMDIVQSVTAGGAGVTVTKSNPRGDLDACKTNLTLNITVPATASEQRVTINLYGNVLGVQTVTATFQIDLVKMPAVSGIVFKDNGTTVSSLISGKTYQMEVSGTLYNTDNLAVKTGTLYNSLGSLASAVRTSYTSTKAVYNVVFNTTQNTGLTLIDFEERRTDCKHSFRANVLAANNSIPLYGKPDVVFQATFGTAIKGLFMRGSLNCAGSPEVESDPNTLTTMKATVGAPTATNATIAREVNWSNIEVSVKNLGAPITTTFNVKLYRGNTLIATLPVTGGINANEIKRVTYIRTPNDKVKKLVRSLGNGCTETATNSGLFETDILTPTYNWLDASNALPFKAVIDNVPNEANTTNNTKTIRIPSDL